MHGRSTLRDLDSMPTSTPLELGTSAGAGFQRAETPRPVQFGNLTIRPVDDAPPELPRETLDASRARQCPKCRFSASIDDASCPKCGVIFAKVRFEIPAPRRAPLDVGMEDSWRGYEARVLSLIASATFIALALFATVPSVDNADMLTMVGVFQLVALLIWIGARAWDWGTKNGAVGVLVLFFTTGWLWPLVAKPIAWVAGFTGVNLPRATGWIVTSVLLALSVCIAMLKST